MQSTPLSDLVKNARREANLTQLELANLSGVSLTQVRDIEQGNTTDPRYSTVCRLFAALDIHDEQPATAA